MCACPASRERSSVQPYDPWGVPLILRRVLPLLPFLFAAACNQAKGLRQKAPIIDASPNPILFQPLAVGKSALASVQVKNLGNLDLHLSKDPYVTEADNDGLV